MYSQPFLLVFFYFSHEKYNLIFQSISPCLFGLLPLIYPDIKIKLFDFIDLPQD
jgi:hypothetical protein